MFATSKNIKEVPQGRALAVIQGCIEALDQGRECLDVLTDEQYLETAKPHVNSAIGEHFRHLLDLFHAVYNSHNDTASSVIDYNFRRRGHTVETSRLRAMDEIAHFIHWLEGLDQDELKASVSILTEVSLTQKKAQLMTSTLERELTFVSLHANHHFAMARVTISLLNIHINGTFGLAPATLSYLRGQ
jgi:uncharacterized damage-inducible protein DinB